MKSFNKHMKKEMYSRIVSEETKTSVFHSNIVPHVIVRIAGQVINIDLNNAGQLRIEVSKSEI